MINLMVLLYIFKVYYNMMVHTYKELRRTWYSLQSQMMKCPLPVKSETSRSWRTLVRPEGEYIQGCIWPQGCGVRLTGSECLRLPTPLLLFSPESTHVFTSQLLQNLLCIRFFQTSHCLLAPLVHVLQEYLDVGWCTLWSVVAWLGVSPVSVVFSEHVAR